MVAILNMCCTYKLILIEVEVLDGEKQVVVILAVMF